MTDLQITTPGGPATLEPLIAEENGILRAHLTSGWSKQAAVYPALSKPWRETEALLDDLHEAYESASQAEQKPEAGQ